MLKGTTRQSEGLERRFPGHIRRHMLPFKKKKHLESISYKRGDGVDISHHRRKRPFTPTTNIPRRLCATAKTPLVSPPPPLRSVKSSNPSLNKEIHKTLLIYLPPQHFEPDESPSHSLKPVHSCANSKPISDETWKTPSTPKRALHESCIRLPPTRRTYNREPIRKRKHGHRTSVDLDPRRKSNCDPRAEVGMRLGHRVPRTRARGSACPILDICIPSAGKS